MEFILGHSERRSFTTFTGRSPYRSVETDFRNKFSANIETLFYMTTPIRSRKLLNLDMQVKTYFLRCDVCLQVEGIIVRPFI